MAALGPVDHLLKQLDELDSILASKEAECKDIRIQRNAIQLAIGFLQSSAKHR